MSERGLTMVLCVGIGTAIGVATNQLATWVAIGAGMGAALTFRNCCCEEKKEGR